MRGRRGVSAEMARVAREYDEGYDLAACLVPSDGGEEMGRRALSDLDQAHGQLLGLYEERGFRLGLAVAAALNKTDAAAGLRD